MKPGDLVRLKPDVRSAMLEDRAIGIVIREAHFSSEDEGHLVDVRFPNEPDIFSCSFETLELISEGSQHPRAHDESR